MIFLTVGTQFPFDRLVSAMDDICDNGLISEEILAQIGETSYKPRNFKSSVSLEKREYDKCVQEASAIISHAGTGIITLALAQNKPLLVMPRLKKYSEVVNDHQLSIARKFSELDYILFAYDVEDLPEGIVKLKTFVPQKRQANSGAVAERIRLFLSSLS
jgi:beta-1,4-N-acetylglucosaminyltransferase